MLRFGMGLVVCALAASAQDARSIIEKVAERYKTLDGYRVEGTYETFSGLNAAAGYVGSTQGKFLIETADKGSKRHIEYEGPNSAMTLISNGSTTWTYLPHEKSYSKMDAVANESDDEEEPEHQNSATSIYELVIRTYSAIERIAPSTEVEREQDVKTSEGKVRCWLLSTKDSERIEKNWVDQQRYLVLKSEIVVPRRQLAARISFSVKRFDVRIPADNEFAFVPPPNAKLVDELALPGRPAFVGKPAADFTLKDLEGEPVTLSELRGKIVVLDFWATWCPPCRHELPTINKLANQLRDKSVVFLGINDEGASTVRSFNKKHEYTFTTLEDTHGKVHHAYAARAIPSVFVIGRDGIIRQHFVGSREEPELLAAIQAAGLE